MDIRFYKSNAAGVIEAPPSKSMAHRLLICAGLSNGTSIIKNVAYSNDILATVDCLSALGVKFDMSGSTVTVTGIDVSSFAPRGALNCRESGSTLRFMIPVALMSGEECMFCGTEYLIHRPQSVYEELFARQGIEFNKFSDRICAKGRLKSGKISINGNVSSQFISGLLFTLPNLTDDSVIEIVPPVESRSYINLTVKSLAAFGVNVVWTDENTLFVKGNQKFVPADVAVEGDYSNACAFDAFNTVGGDVTVTGLDENSLQGDRVYKEYFDRLKNGCPQLDISDCPDLGPVLFAVAGANNGALFTGTERLKIKESDRIAAMRDELKKVGISVTEEDNSVRVQPGELHAPSDVIQSHNDHRIVMAMSLILSLTGGVLTDAQAVNKSLPDFFDSLEKIDVKFDKHLV